LVVLPQYGVGQADLVADTAEVAVRSAHSYKMSRVLAQTMAVLLSPRGTKRSTATD